jgi:hypothetical protein
MKMLRTQAIEDGAIPSNDNKPQLTKGWTAFINTLEQRAGSVVTPSKERFQITWFDDVDQSTAKEEILQSVLARCWRVLLVCRKTRHGQKRACWRYRLPHRGWDRLACPQGQARLGHILRCRAQEPNGEACCGMA